MCVAAAHWRVALTRSCQAVARALRTSSGAAVGLVLSSVMLLSVLGPGTPQVAGAASGADLQRIDPELLLQMTAQPLRRLPVIVEMRPPAPPFPVQANQQRA